MDQLSAMRVFIRVVETGNLTRAADSLSMPKATVSNLIRGLEAHLRTKLLNRTTRRVIVTTDGALYYERALKIVSDLETLDASLSSSQNMPTGRLRVEMTGAFATSIIAPALCDFYEKYPDIRIDLGVSDGVVDYVGQNVDCALRAGEPSDQSLIARRVGELELITCAAPRYLQNNGTPEHPEDLETGHRAIGYFRSQNSQAAPFEFARNGETLKVSPSYRLSVNDGRTFLKALTTGLGIGQTARFIAREAIARGELVPVLPGWSRDPLPLFIVYTPNRHLSNKVRVFVDWMARLLANAKLNEI